MTTALAQPPAQRRTRLRAALRKQETRWGLIFLSPWLIGFVVFTAGPMLVSLALSFTRFDAASTKPAEFVGLANYERLLADPKVRLSLENTFFFAILHVPLSMMVALGLALLLNRIGRAARIFRTIFYLPVMTPPVAIGILWLMLLNPQVGLVNRALELIGLQGPGWIYDPNWVKPAIVLMSLWTVGSTVIIYFAALRNVPQELYEAARIDGASGWQQFRAITVPMISGALFFTLIVNTINALQIFSEIWTMFFGGQRGTTSDAALFYVVYLFQNAFEFTRRMGFASAMAWLLFVVIVLITLIQLRVSRRWVYYAGD